MDIYEYLHADHEKVSEMMDKVIESKSSTERARLFQKIKKELTLHADSEEPTFYQAIKDATSEQKVEAKIEHAEKEHDEVKVFLSALSDAEVDNEEWIKVFKKFQKAVTHHVKEEEGAIFEKARKCLSDNKAKELVAEMKNKKTQLKADMGVDG